jgi:hypothetical protein
MKKIFFIIGIVLLASLLFAQEDEFIRVIRLQNDLCIFNNGNSRGDELCVTAEYNYDYFRFIKQPDGYYYIINPNNGLYLEPKSNPTVAGSKIIQNNPRGDDRQKWKILPGGLSDYYEHYYYILPKTNEDLYLTERGGKVILTEFSTVKSLEETRVASFHDCFSSNSLVLTKNGYKSIGNIDINDMVATWNIESERLEYSEIDTIFIHSDEKYKLTRISFVNHNMLYATSNEYYHVQLLEATSNHPLLTPDGFKPVGEIIEGDIIYYYTEFSTELQECLIVGVERDILTVNEVYNIRLTNGMPYIVNHAVASPKCPFVSVITKDGPYEISEVLRNQLGKILDKYEQIEIPISIIDNEELIIRIDERKDEISYLDHIYLLVDDQVVYPEYCNSLKNIFEANDKYIELNNGEYIDLRFLFNRFDEKPAKVYLVVKGYYILL